MPIFDIVFSCKNIFILHVLNIHFICQWFVMTAFKYLDKRGVVPKNFAHEPVIHRFVLWLE